MEPIRKMTMALWKIFLRPNMSLILPYNGVATALVSKYEVATHEYLLSPCRSLAIRGKAVETMVWSRAARSMASMRALMITIISPCERSVFSATLTNVVFGVVSAKRILSVRV